MKSWQGTASDASIIIPSGYAVRQWFSRVGGGIGARMASLGYPAAASQLVPSRSR